MFKKGQKSGLEVSALHSWLEDWRFEYRPLLDGNGVKAMPGSILVHSIIGKKENIGSQMGHSPQKIYKNIQEWRHDDRAKK